jgi:hypothetical protein
VLTLLVKHVLPAARRRARLRRLLRFYLWQVRAGAPRLCRLLPLVIILLRPLPTV